MKISAYLSVIFLFFSLSSQADIVVIVNENNTEVLSKKDIKRIFLGRLSRFSDGTKIQTAYLKAGDSFRTEFNNKVLKKSNKELNRYWSRVSFSGKASMPKEFDSMDQVVQFVARTPGGIGYIDTSVDVSTVTVVTIFESVD